MKIIGHTSHGYLVEIQPSELAKITGNRDHDKHSSRNYYGRNEQSHSIGTEFHVSATWDHLQLLLNNEPERKRIAESLRAAATLVEHTPSPITTLPPEPEQAAQ